MFLQRLVIAGVVGTAVEIVLSAIELPQPWRGYIVIVTASVAAFAFERLFARDVPSRR